MTREEAIEKLKDIAYFGGKEGYEAVDMAISALSADGDLIRRADAIEATWKEPSYTDAINVLTEVRERIKALPSAEAVSREEYEMQERVIEGLQAVIDNYKADYERFINAQSAEAVQGWIPFTRRPMTEEEQKDYPNCTFMFDCVLPDDGDEILVSNRRFVWMDTFCSDIDGCYLDGGDDIDEDMAWMPLPTPYKGGEDE